MNNNNNMDVSNTSQFTITYNLKLNVKVIGQKPTKKQTTEANLPQHTKTKDFNSITELADFLSKGHTLYAGTFKQNIDSCSNDNIDYSNIIFLDFDNNPIDEIVSTDIVADYGAIVHPSYSANPNNPVKFHLIFITSRKVSCEEYIILWEHVVNKINKDIDKSKKAPSNLLFGSPHEVFILGEKRLPVDEILAISEKQNQFDTVGENSESKNKVTLFSDDEQKDIGITEQVLNYLYDKLFIEKLDSDVESLYCLWEHNWNIRKLNSKDRAENILYKIDGCNPWKPSTTGNGDSFGVSFYEGCLPVWYDRSNNYEGNHNYEQTRKNGGTYLTYWFEVHKKRSLEPFSKFIKYEGELTGKNFQKVTHDICDYFEIPRFNFKQKSKFDSNKIIEALKEFTKNRVFRILKDDETWFCYDSRCKTWIYAKKLPHIYATVISHFIIENFGEEVSENKDVKSAIKNWFQDYHFECLEKFRNEDTNYMPFTNGVYDIEKKVLLNEKVDAFNQSRIQFDYRVVDDNEDVIIRFKKYWEKWTNCSIQGEFLLNWIILNVQRQAYRTGKTVGLIGDAGTGKSTYGEFLVQLFDKEGGIPFAVKVNADRITSKSNNHSTAVLENCYCAVLDELKGNTLYTDIEKLKEFTGQTDGISLTINPKNQKERTILCRTAFTWNRQDMVKIDFKDDGFFRRNVIIKLDENVSKKVDNAVEIGFLRQRENLKKIFCWCLQQNTDESLCKIKDLSSNTIFESFKTHTIRENSDIAQYITQEIIVTNDSKDKIPCVDIINDYTIWANENHAQKYGRIKFGQDFIKIMSNIKLGFNWAFKESSVDKNSKGDSIRIYRGVKFKNTDKIYK